MSERLAADAANVTVGRQQRTAGGHLLGAGLVAPDSTHENFTELGLSADLRAMGHGVKHLHVAAPPSGSAAAAAPSASSSSSSSSVATLLPPVAGSAAQQASAAVPAQQQARQQQQQQQQDARPIALGERQQERPHHHHHGSRSGKFNSGTNTRDAGRAQLVAPESQQKAWWATAWDRLRHAVLGTSEDLFELQPPWIKHPDYGRLNNINALLLGLWPTLSAAIEQQLVLQMAPALLSDAAKTYGAGYLTGLQLTEFSLGQVPPRLDGLKVYQENDDEQLMMEAAAAWGSLAKVTVSATLQLMGRTFTLPLTVQNLQFKALMRLTAQPLLTEPPYVGQVGVTLLEPPHIDFELPLAGLDVMALPLLRGAWRLGAKLAARQFVVYPKGIQLPLVEGIGTRGSPSGMLEVKLVKLKGLRSEDLIGHSDPYVRLRLRQGRELRSRTIHNNNEPVFNQTFSLLVEDPDTQVLQLMVFDEDMGGLKDKVIGVCQMPLKQSAPLLMPKTRVPITLDIHKLLAPGQGAAFQLPIRAAGLPISAGRWLFKNLEGALGSSNQQAAAGSSYDTVLDETGWLGPSEQAMAEDRAPKGAYNQGRDVAGSQAPAGPAGQPGGVMASPAAAAAGSDDAAGTPRSSHSSSSSVAGGSMSAAASPFSTAGTAAPVQQQQSAGFGSAVLRGVKRVVRRPSADDVSDPASAARLRAGSDSDESGSDYTTIRQAAYNNWQRHQGALVAGSGSGMQRLSSHSAPLSSTYGVVGSNSGSSAAATIQQAQGQQPVEAAAGEQSQQQDGTRDKDQSLRQQQGAAERGGPQAVAGDQLQPVRRGVAFLELTYTPIRQPDSQPSGAGAAPAPGVQAAAATGRVPVSPTDKGILAVSLVRAKGLTGWSGEADPYVTLTILETAQATGAGSSAGVCGKGVQELHQSREPHRSSTIFNEDSPRWNEKFDFIDISASSVLLATVWDQTSWIESATSLKLTTMCELCCQPIRTASPCPAQGAIMGELEMVLQWIPAELME